MPSAHQCLPGTITIAARTAVARPARALPVVTATFAADRRSNADARCQCANSTGTVIESSTVRVALPSTHSRGRE